VPINPIELLGPALLMAAVAVTLVPSKRLLIRVFIAVCGSATIFITVSTTIGPMSIGPTTVGKYFLGTFGPGSAASLVIIGGYLHGKIIGKKYQTSHALLLCLTAIGVIFYPLTFGLSNFDPYELGYRGFSVPGLMLVFLVIGWVTRSVDVLYWISLAALLYAFGAYDSNNLWDYLIFPIDPIYAVVALAIAIKRPYRRPGETHSELIS
jgi:hypothetical protein